MTKKIEIILPKSVSYAKAIRRKCLDCTCNQDKEIRYCTIHDCPLFPYRFGTSPYTYVERNKDNVKIIK